VYASCRSSTEQLRNSSWSRASTVSMTFFLRQDGQKPVNPT
jgi:hypothetical protein